MDEADPRATLDRLVRERKDDYVGLSRMLGRNPAYLQQFIKRGVPRRLAEADRRELARYFSVSEQLLGAPAPVAAACEDRLVTVPRLTVFASAGHGETVGAERSEPAYAFDRAMLRALTGGRTEGLSVIGVRGDSMQPTFLDGDDILVDRNPDARRLRDGVYVLRVGGDLIVKRVAMRPAGFDVLSDNDAYPAWRDCRPQDVDVIGRVVWTGRRVS